jgi:hypothetical protein
VVVIVVLIAAMASISVAVAVAFKDSYTSDATFVNSNNAVLRVGAAEYQVPLIVAPILPIATLASVMTLTLTVPDPTGERAPHTGPQTAPAPDITPGRKLQLTSHTLLCAPRPPTPYRATVPH